MKRFPPSKTFSVSILAATTALVAGCRSPLEQGPYADWLEENPAVWSSDAAEAHHPRSATRSASAPPSSATSPDAPNALDASAHRHAAAPTDVEGWIALALRTNPQLHAAEYRVERMKSRKAQATSLDDPTLRLAPIGEFAQTAAGDVQWTASISQTLPLPEKLEAQGQAAAHDAEAARQQLAALQLRVAADVRRAFWSYVYTLRGAVVLEQDKALLLQFRDIAEVKYRAGTVEQQDVLRAKVELAGLDNDLLMLAQRNKSAAGMLNRLTDRPIDAAIPTPATASLDTIDVDLDLNLKSLLAAAADHPRLAALRQRVARFHQQRRLAKLDRYPDLTVSAGYNAVSRSGPSAVADGDDQWWVGVGINLPLWQNKRDAAEREALAGVMETTALLVDEQNQLAFRVNDALSRVEAQRGSVALFETRMLPEARQAVEAAEGSYRAGRTDFLTLIDNARRLTELELMYQRALTQLQQDLADLRLAAGLPAQTGEPHHD